MIESTLDCVKNEGHIMVRPNMSGDWRTTRIMLWLVSSVALIIAGSFASVGLWLILPFAGLEVIALIVMMYWAAYKCCRKQVITLDGSRVIVEKGYRTPKFTWESEVFWTRLVIQKAPYRGHPSRVYLRSKLQHLEIGDFLDEKEKKMLVDELRQVINVLS